MFLVLVWVQHTFGGGQRHLLRNGILGFVGQTSKSRAPPSAFLPPGNMSQCPECISLLGIPLSMHLCSSSALSSWPPSWKVGERGMTEQRGEVGGQQLTPAFGFKGDMEDGKRKEGEKRPLRNSVVGIVGFLGNIYGSFEW